MNVRFWDGKKKNKTFNLMGSVSAYPIRSFMDHEFPAGRAGGFKMGFHGS